MIIHSFYLLCFPLASDQTLDWEQQSPPQTADGGALLTVLSFECLMDRCGCVTAAVAVSSCLIFQVRTMSLQARPCLFVWCFQLTMTFTVKKRGLLGC